jgi:hypothetical protein
MDTLIVRRISSTPELYFVHDNKMGFITLGKAMPVNDFLT